MNAVEQRTHRTVTQSLDERLAVVESLTEQLLRNDSALAHASGSLHERISGLDASVGALIPALGSEGALAQAHGALSARLDEAHQRIDFIGSLLDETHRRLAAHESLTVWQRLRWLWVGR